MQCDSRCITVACMGGETEREREGDQGTRERERDSSLVERERERSCIDNQKLTEGNLVFMFGM